jgi:hypothetical protein
MKKTYIIPTADVVEIKVNHLLMTSSMELIGDETLVDSGDFLSREVEMDEDDFDFEDEEEF